MKSKATTIFLLICVLFIWSWVIYKFYNGVKNDSNSYIIKNIPINTVETIAELSFSLHNYARDPFLSILKDTITHIEEETSLEVKKNKTIEKPKIDLPIYCGIMQNNDNKKMAIVKHNGKYHFVSEQEKLAEYSVLKITTEQLIVIDDNKNRITIALLKEKQ